MSIRKYPPVYIVGPTASGKSALAVLLASEIESVIISADSMQIYRGLDIGTAKDSIDIRNKYDYKLIDIVDYDQEFSVAEWAQLAKQEIEKAQNKGKLPIIVGGTGLYFDALLYPMNFANTIKNQDLRDKLANELAEYGPKYLHDKLESLDIQTAKRLHVNDTKRVIRALEIIITTGKTLEENKDIRQDPNVIMIGLNTDRAKLYDKINARVDEMFQNGLVNEVYGVGSFDHQSMQAIGYKEFKNIKPIMTDNGYRIDEKDLTEVKNLIKQHTRNYAKRQLTWFRKYNFVKWFECGDNSGAIDYIKQCLNKNDKTI